MALRCSLLALGLAATATTACAPDTPEVDGARLFAMGTWVEISTAGVDAVRVDSAIGTIATLLRDYEKDYYAWGDGELARLNDALATGSAFEASAALADLVATAKALSIASGGSFDPAVAPLVEAWGFHDSTAGEPIEPPAATISALLRSNHSISSLRVDGRRIESPDGPVQLDLGGIAKGRAVDLIVESLTQAGITNALVNAGGDLRVLGSPPGRHWRIGIQSPRASDSIGTVELRDGEAAFTSGDYERYFDSAGGRMHHILDPTTGYPATHTQAVTVLADEGTLADAAATAIFVAGPARWRDVARKLAVDAVLRVTSDGQIEVTPAMRDRLQISAEHVSDIITVSP